MWLAHLDEAGNTGRRLDDPEQPIHEVLALLTPEEQISELHAAVRRVAHEWFPVEHSQRVFEFHGAAIFRGEGPFAVLDVPARIALYEDLLQVVSQVGAKLIIRGVDKPRLAARYPNPYHPHDIALMFTLEAIERFARRQSARSLVECRFLVVADENKETEDSALRDLASYQQFGTGWGWNPIAIDHIIDTIHFVRSETNWAIQLADCLAFLESRRARIERGIVPRNQSAEAVLDMFERLVRPHLFVLRIWEA
jgi:hypothetical protein